MGINYLGAGYIVPYTFEIDAGDNETSELVKLGAAGKVRHVTFVTNGALGAGVGVDLVDGGSDGTGTDVIIASTDNLNGEEEKTPADSFANEELADGDVLNVTIDDVTARTVRVVASVKHYKPF